MIFAVLDVSLAVNLCINCSFIIFIFNNGHAAGKLMIRLNGRISCAKYDMGNVCSTVPDFTFVGAWVRDLLVGLELSKLSKFAMLTINLPRRSVSLARLLQNYAR